MDYSAQFAVFREGRNLSQDELAGLAGCHRNTVINVERGRPVKFATIAELMDRMGYPKDSRETKLLALLWLEAKTGITVTLAEAMTERGGKVEKSMREMRTDLAARVKRMDRTELEIIHFAATHREIINALKAIRALTETTQHLPKNGQRPNQ